MPIRTLSDRATIALAAAAVVGALVPTHVPAAAGVLAVALALAGRRPLLLVGGAGLLASSLAAASWAGLGPPDLGPVAGEALVVTDPVAVAGAVKADLDLDGRRVEAWARGRAAAELGDRLAGERISVEGRLQPVPDAARERLAVRHVGARLSVDRVSAWRPGSPASRVANHIRQTLVGGARSLGEERQGLLSGFLLGDTRDHPPEVVADFRVAGLTHLLAVSGQNVALVLLLVAPALRYLGLGGRWLAAIAVIGLFAVVTRFEPSVLRASAMAALAVTAWAVGRPVSRTRLLALAVTALVVADPLLVHSVGFRLSVAATAGILALAGPITARLPGPRPLAATVAVTLAAQAAVAPVLVGTFDGMPVAALPANLLAVPVAGLLVAWGLGAGMVAGLVGGPAAEILHLPTAALVWWVAGVARWAAGLPLGTLGAGHLAVAALAALALAVLRDRRLRRVVGAALALALVVHPALLARGPVAGAEVAPDARLWRSGSATVLVVAGAADPARTLGGLRAQGVGRLDVVVLERGTLRHGLLVAVLRRRITVGAVVAPDGNQVRDAVVVGDGTIGVGDLVVTIEGRGTRLAAGVARAGDDG